MAPSISSAAGTATTGSTITISGTGFDTKPASKAEIFCTFQESTGDPVTHTTLSNSSSLTNRSNSTTTVTADATHKRWGANVCTYTATGSENGWHLAHNMASLALGSKFRIMFWRKSPNYPTTGNWKNIRIWPKGADSGYPNSYYGTPDISAGGWLWSTEGGTAVTGESRKYFGDSVEPEGTSWRLEQWVLKLNTVQGTSDGTIIRYINNTQITSDTTFRFDHTGLGNIIGNVYIQDVKSGNITAGTKVHLADVMLDYGWNCVFIGNASTFAACTQLEFQPYTSWSSTNITINCQLGSFASAAGKYLYVVDDSNVASTGFDLGSLGGTPAPTVTSVTPTAGALAGGTAITIAGSDFSASINSVKINGISCTSVVRNSATEITAVTPANSAGTYSLVVENSDSQTGTLASAYTYQAAPTITSVSPSTGATAGGTTIVLTGTGYTSTVTGVTIGGTSCTSVVRDSATQITCVTPAKAAGTYSIVVTNSDSQTGTLTDGFTYTGGPVVTTVAPSNLPLAGATIVLTGSNFTATINSVTVGGTACTSVVRDSSTQITCVAPAKSAGTYDVVVTNSDTQTGTKSNGVTYAAAPTVTSVSPSSGTVLGGTTIVVTGTGFSTTISAVNVGEEACTSVVRDSATQITCVTPAGAAIGLYDIEVVNSDGQNDVLEDAFTYTTAASLVLTTLDPDTGNAGETHSVTIYGGNFSSASVTVGGVVATQVVTVDSSTITARFPALTIGSYDVVVTNSNGVNGTFTDGFHYIDPVADSYRVMRWRKFFPRFY